MKEKQDIQNKEDLERMLKVFYEKAFQDDLIRHFFIEVVPLDLTHHIPIIAAFWDSVLFNTHGYRKNVMQIHTDINRLSPIQKPHLDRWVQLFTQTVDEFFAGDKAELAKQRAASIATLMNIKIHHPDPLKR